MATFVENVKLETIHCAKCNILFAVTARFQQDRRDDHKDFFCPRGHSNYYPQKSDQEKLKEELKRRERELASQQMAAADLRSQRDEAERKYRRMRKRVANGVCPCCNRTFQNLMQHMKTEHPDFGTEKTLRSLRVALGMTQADLAKEVGCSPAYVSRYENGKGAPRWAAQVIEHWAEKFK